MPNFKLINRFLYIEYKKNSEPPAIIFYRICTFVYYKTFNYIVNTTRLLAVAFMQITYNIKYR